MKFDTKTILIIIFVALALLFGQQALRKSELLKQQQLITKKKESQVELWEDRYGRSHAKRMAAEADRFLIKDSYKKEIDSLEKNFDVKLKNLQSATNVVTKTVIKVDSIPFTDTVYIDNILYRKFEWQDDPWVYLYGRANDSFVSVDSLIVNDSVSLVLSYTKKNLFSRRELSVQALSGNPYTRIKDIRSISVKGKSEGRWIIGPSVGVTYDGSVKPYVGVGLTFRLISF